jgi:hypothetical protein
LKLKYDELLSNVAFKFDLRRYTEVTLRAILEALISRSSFPEDMSMGGPGVGVGAGVDFSDGDSVQTKEAEQEVIALRLELGVLFRNIAARLSPALALAVGAYTRPLLSSS